MVPLLPSMPANPEAEGKPVPLEVKTSYYENGNRNSSSFRDNFRC